MRGTSEPRAASATRAAVAPFSALELADRLKQVVPAEIGPQGGHEEEVGVSRLPEEEIAQALLAARANEQVGIRKIGRRQLAAEQLLGDVVGPQTPLRHLAGEPLRGRDDLAPAAVIHGHGQGHAAIVPRALLGAVDERADITGKPETIADETETHSLAMQLGDLAPKIEAQEAHQ